MAYQVLARKWRPQCFNEVIGQEPIVRSLSNALLKNRVAHAYLFTGTRGVGKTSMARIFATALRCEKPKSDGNPCLECLSCRSVAHENSMDVIEIDGASNNGVDHVRVLIENVHYLPTSGRYKVYIIDEVHMLSKEAFNALLKTLEAPPDFVVFIFATTVPEKLLDTVLSRCQRFDFKEVTPKELQKFLIHVGEKEQIHFKTAELAYSLAIEAQGSVRDALSLLDQVNTYSPDGIITDETLHLALGTVRQEKLTELINALYQGGPNDVSRHYRSILSQSVNLKRLVLAILDRFYERVVAGPSNPTAPEQHAELFWIYETLIKDFQWALESLAPEKAVEVVLQKVAYRKTFFSSEGTTAPTETPTPAEPPPPTPTPPSVSPVTTPVIQKTWDEFIDFVYQHHPTLAANLEHGNGLHPMALVEGDLKIDVAFAASGKIFYDYLSPPEQQEQIITILAQFFAIPKERVNLRLLFLNQKEKEKLQFQGHVEKQDQKQRELQQQQQHNFADQQIIKNAEALFGGQVEQIQIYKKNQEE